MSRTPSELGTTLVPPPPPKRYSEAKSNLTVANPEGHGLPFLCPPHPVAQLHAKERMFFHGMLDTKRVTRMGRAVANMDLPCDWAHFLYNCAERGIEDSAIIIIATWFREGPAMTQQLYMNHGHPDGDLMTSFLAYQWFEETRKHFRNQYADQRVAWNEEWNVCARVGLMHHVMRAISESVQVLSKAFEDHKDAFPQVPKRNFGSLGFSTLLAHSTWTAFFDRCLNKLPTGEHVFPQYGGAWILENSSLAHFL